MKPRGSTRSARRSACDARPAPDRGRSARSRRRASGSLRYNGVARRARWRAAPAATRRRGVGGSPRAPARLRRCSRRAHRRHRRPAPPDRRRRSTAAYCVRMRSAAALCANAAALLKHNAPATIAAVMPRNVNAEAAIEAVVKVAVEAVVEAVVAAHAEADATVEPEAEAAKEARAIHARRKKKESLIRMPPERPEGGAVAQLRSQVRHARSHRAPPCSRRCGHGDPGDSPASPLQRPRGARGHARSADRRSAARCAAAPARRRRPTMRPLTHLARHPSARLPTLACRRRDLDTAQHAQPRGDLALTNDLLQRPRHRPTALSSATTGSASGLAVSRIVRPPAASACGNTRWRTIASSGKRARVVLDAFEHHVATRQIGLEGNRFREGFLVEPALGHQHAAERRFTRMAVRRAPVRACPDRWPATTAAVRPDADGDC